MHDQVSFKIKLQAQPSPTNHKPKINHTRRKQPVAYAIHSIHPRKS